MKRWVLPNSQLSCTEAQKRFYQSQNTLTIYWISVWKWGTVTTIVAVQLPNKVMMGADSQTTSDSGLIYRHPEVKKIVANGKFLIAGAGDAAPSDLCQYVWQSPTPRGVEWNDLYRFMITKAMPSLRQCFKDNDFKIDSDTSFSFLFAIGGEVFDVSEDFSVLRKASGIYGIGSGSGVAIGAIEQGATIERALEIAAENDAYTSAPFVFHTQKKITRTTKKND
jgi:ATP-dependent protease HslVU (ClpYQ) peptidase subunit